MRLGVASLNRLDWWKCGGSHRQVTAVPFGYSGRAVRQRQYPLSCHQQQPVGGMASCQVDDQPSGTLDHSPWQRY